MLKKVAGARIQMPFKWHSNAIFCLSGCSHYRANEYFVESITATTKFIGVQCDSYENFENGDCGDNPQAEMGFTFDPR